MSGHSKWATIRRAKEANDSKRGNIFTKHVKNIILAAKGGGDPEMNPALKTAIDNAKKDNLPNANIDKAIKKGTGELKDGNEIVEVMYEGYGPEGIAVIVICHTDNKQRTVSNVRHLFSKHGGNMGDKGCVAYLFDRKGVIMFENATNNEEIEMAAIEADCDDVSVEDGNLEILTPPTKLHEISESLTKAGYKPSSVELTMIPQTYIKISEQDKMDRIIKFMEVIESDDDVNQVISNFEIDL